jgi:CubicO group peptidase (beta-lactamase class C family)
MASEQAAGTFRSAVGLVAQRGTVVFEGAVGELGPGTPMPVDAIFRWSSITKPLTAVAVLQLAEAGKIRLDQPVADIFPEYGTLKVGAADGAAVPLVRPITIADLLTHQAGFAADGDKIWALFDAPTVLDFSKGLAAVPLKDQPGTTFEYGPSYEVLAAIVERASGERFDAYIRKHVLTPLAMQDTSFFVPPDKASRLAAVWQLGSDGAWTMQRRRGQEETPNNFFSGGGGLRGTAQDYYRFAQMLLNGGTLDGRRILSERSVRLMTSNHTADRYGLGGFGWGYGVRVKTGESESHAGSIGSFGWAGGTGTAFLVDPATQLVAIIAVPSNPGPSAARVDPFKKRFLWEAYKAAASGQR